MTKTTNRRKGLLELAAVAGESVMVGKLQASRLQVEKAP